MVVSSKPVMIYLKEGKKIKERHPLIKVISVKIETEFELCE